MELDKALYMLESRGYTVTKPATLYMTENAKKSLVDTVKEKYDEWESLRDSPEGDDLWDALVEEYGYDLIDLVSNDYEEIKSGKILDMTNYFRDADGIYPEFIQMMKQVGAKTFMFDTRVAFRGNAGYLFQALTDTKVNFDRYKYIKEVPNTNYAVLEIDKDA